MQINFFTIFRDSFGTENAKRVQRATTLIWLQSASVISDSISPSLTVTDSIHTDQWDSAVFV